MTDSQKVRDCPRCGLNQPLEGSPDSALCTPCEWHTAAEALGQGVEARTEWAVDWQPGRSNPLGCASEDRAREKAAEFGWGVVARRVIVGPWEER